MRICPRLLSGLATNRRKPGIIVACTLALSSLGLSEPARAQCAGPLNDFICTPGGNNYPAGINVDGNPNNPVALTLQSGVNVVIPFGSPGVNAVNASNSAAPTTFGNPVTLTANGTTANGITITNNNNPTSNNVTGLRIQSAGSATIMATNTDIDVAGTASDDAILAIIEGNNPASAPQDVTVTWTGQHLTSSGTESTGIQADNRGNGNDDRGFRGCHRGRGRGQLIFLRLARSCR